MRKILWIVFPVLLLLVAFFLLDVRLMSSRSSENSTVAANHNSDFNAARDLTPSVTGLYVAGDGAVARLLLPQIKTLLQNQASIGQVTAINAPADQFDFPVLFVEVSPVKHFWTPFYASAEYQLSLSYASNGNTSFRKDAVTHFKSSGDQPFLQFKATTTIADKSFGIISMPGYRNYLAGKLADQVSKTLHAQLQD